MRTIILTLAGLILLIFILTINGIDDQKTIALQKRHIAEQRAALDRIPTIKQIQKMVGCEKIDGIIGPNTIEKWERAICDQEYKKMMDRMRWIGKNTNPN